MSTNRLDSRPRKRRTSSSQQSELLEIRQLLTASPVVAAAPAAATPTVAWQSNAPQALLGDTFQVGLTFSNPGGTGYGPYVDIVVPRGQIADQGIQYVSGSARLLDSALSESVVQFDTNGNAVHPFAMDAAGSLITLKGNPGDQLVVLQMPFGSFVQNQPSLQITMQMTMGQHAAVGTQLSLVASSGFRYGNDALDNPKTDAPIRGTSATLAVTPALVTTRISYLGPENETATGANFVQSYRVDVDVAIGANINQLTLDNLLDSNEVFVGMRNVSWDPKSFKVLSTPVTGVAAANSHLTLQLGSMTGKAGLDGSYILDFYVPNLNANSQLVADPILGTDAKSVFSVQATGSWVVTPATSTTAAVINTFASAATHTLADQNIAVQQSYRIVTDSNASGLGPGDVLEYRINFQVSDYTWIQDLLLKTAVPNGQRLLSDIPVTFTASGIKGYADGSVTTSKIGLSLLTQGKTTGQLDYQFDVTKQLQTLGLDGILRGGATLGSTGHAVTGSITYRTVVLDSFEDGVPSGDLPVDEGDVFSNRVLATGTTVNPSTQLATVNHAYNDSGLTQQMATGSLSTTVYAINGLPASPGAPVKAGDLVTYEIKRSVISSDIENLSISEYLPLPIYQVGNLTWQGSNPANNAGSIRIGSTDTFHSLYNITPQISIDKTGNSVKLSYGTVNSPANKTTTLDLLVTVAVQDQPFADGMWLTGMARSDQGSSNNGSFSQTAITSVQYTRPVLSLLKSAISSDNLSATLSGAVNNTNISRIDSGDTVRFQIYVENTGLSLGGAYNVLVKDVIPQGFVIPAAGLGMTVTDSSGKALRYSLVNSGNPNSLLSGGIQLIDTLSSGQATNGSNRLVVQYNLQAVDVVHAGIVSSSSASLVVYTALPKGNNYVTTTLTDGATETIATPTIQHTLISTDQPNTTGNQVVIGETATYSALVTIPEVTMNNSVLEIDAPRGLTIKNVVGVKVDGSLSLATTDAAKILASATISNLSSLDQDAGRVLRLQIGDIVNKDRDNTHAETIEIIYTATVTNDVTNLVGTSLRSNAVWSYDTTRSTALLASEVKVVEPKLVVSTTWSANNVDANDSVTVTIDVGHSSSSGSTAFDIGFTDTFPNGVTYVPGSLTWVSGPVPTKLTDSTGLIQATWGSIDKGTTSRMQYKVIVNKDVPAGLPVAVTSKVSWTSISGTPGQIASTNPLAVERTGNTADVGGAANNYLVTTNSNIVIAPVKVAMTLISTTLSHPVLNQLTIGERATYQIVLTVPEGVTPLDLNIPQQFASGTFQPESLTLVSVGKSLIAPSIAAGKTLLATNGQLDWNLGVVTNVPDNKVTTGDTIVFQLTGLIPNVSSNVAGSHPAAMATVSYPYGPVSATSAITVVEPQLTIVQNVSRANVDAGDVVNSSLVISHSGGTSHVAFSLDLDSLVSPGLTLVPGSVKTNLGTIVTGNGSSDKTLQILLGQMSDTQTIQVQYQVKVSTTFAPGSTLQLPASVSWKSMSTTEGRAYATQVSTPITINSNTFAGTVFADFNQDGKQLQGTDISLFQVPLQLTGVDHLGNSIQMSTTTDASGHYQFAGLRAGTYSITETQPAKWFDGKDYAGTAGGVASNDRIDVTLPLESNVVATGYNFTESPLTWIAGTVYVDADQNAKLGQDEAGVANVTMTLTGTTDLGVKVNRTTQTNDRGYYVFDHLDSGTYSVSEGTTPGYFDASNQVGTQGGFLTGNTFSNIIAKATAPGEMYNFGKYLPASISGQVYIDYDRDGVLDRKDALIANVEADLTGVNDLGQKVAAIAYTDAKGRYSFGNLRPGNYSVSTTAVEGLDFEVANVGRVLGAYGPSFINGKAVDLGFASIQLGAGIADVGYNVGHTDPNYDPTILARSFDSQVAFDGTHGNDSFSVQVSSTGATISINGKSFQFDSSSSESFRLLGSFGTDTLKISASEDKEEINLHKNSSTVTGTWFEIRSYGMEQTSFVGGGNEDVARFYDSDTDDKFTAAPFNATMEGTGYKNHVEGVHRIYAYATSGSDAASLTGAVGQRDNFSAEPGNARLYGDQFYLYASGFDSVIGNATDASDRAYLYGSTGDDQLQASQSVTTLQGKEFKFTANNFQYSRIQLDQGGTDSGVLTGSDGNDSFFSRPTESTFNVGSTQIIVQDAEKLEVRAGLGTDTASVYDTHYDDTFTASPTKATMVNQVSSTTMTGFEKVNAYANAGGIDQAFISGSSGADVFTASPTDWSLTGTGYSLNGTGFTQVTAYGDASDVASLSDSTFNDSLLLSSTMATLSGQLYSNSAVGFGTVKAASSGGDDSVTFVDDTKGATVQITDTAAIFFGNGFNDKVTGFNHYDAFFQSLAGNDNVQVQGHVQYVMMAVNSDKGKYKLSLGVSSTTPAMNLNTTVDKLNLTT